MHCDLTLRITNPAYTRLPRTTDPNGKLLVGLMMIKRDKGERPLRCRGTDSTPKMAKNEEKKEKEKKYMHTRGKRRWSRRRKAHAQDIDTITPVVLCKWDNAIKSSKPFDASCSMVSSRDRLAMNKSVQYRFVRYRRFSRMQT